MPAGTKRKASFASPYERPSKLSKKSSSTTVSRTLSKITKHVSVGKPPLSMPKFPTLRATKITEEVSASAPLPDDKDSPTPPALRRASTLTLEDDSSKGTSKGHTRESSLTKPLSMSKKSSSFVEKGALVTRLSGLKSGSLIGETALATSTSLIKEPSLSKSFSKESSAGRSATSIPSGLTKLALSTGASKTGSLHVSASTLVTDVDETEMASALDSLKAHLSKEGSKKTSMSKSASKLSKSASVRSTKSAGSDAAADNSGEPEAEMDTSVASSSSDHADIAVHSGMMEVAISFDTTGSMYGSLEEVRAKVQDLVQRLQADIPGIRVAIIAHGDYCDESTYIVKWIDFGASLPELCDFVKNVGSTGGGDGPECYELVMQRAREVLSWSPGSKRILIMIGDNLPHEPGYTYGGKTYHINWRDECAALKEMNVKVYGVQAGHGCNTESEIKRFFEEMARITGGKRLTLQNFTSLFDVLMMVCYREGNPEMLAIYEQEILDRGERMADDIHALKNTFHGTSTPAFGSTFTTEPLGRGRGKVRRPKVGKMGKTEVKPKAKKGKADSGPVAVKAKGFAKKAKDSSVKVKKPLAASPKKTIQKKQIKKLSKTAAVQKREKLPDACMNKGPLKSIVWSNWIRAVEPNMPAGKSKDKYVKLRTLKGFGLKKIFDGNLKTPAIYEVAVQTGSNKKYVVYMMQKRGFRRPGMWATNLFRDKKVRSEVDNNITQGGSVYIRRGVPKAKSTKLNNQQISKAGEFIRDNYDYAWKKYIWRRTKISGSKLFGLKHRLLKIKRKGKTYTLSNDNL